MIFKRKGKTETMCKSKNCKNMSGNRKLYFRRYRRRKLSKDSAIVNSKSGSYKKVLGLFVDILQGSGSNSGRSSTILTPDTNCKQRCAGRAVRYSRQHLPLPPLLAPEFVAKFWH